jgi:hypothetical protein
MKRVILFVVLAAMSMAMSAAPASAQAIRTWVSGVGDDVNPCSRTAPCKTWAGAISKTAAGGMIDCLDPAGYGAVTITKSISIWCEETGVMGALVAGTNGIVIAAGATDVVTLQGLNVEGLLGNGSAAAPGLTGILVTSAAEVHIDKVKINGMKNWGIDFKPSGNSKLTVNDTVIDNCGTAATFSGGIQVDPAGTSNAKVALNRVTIGNTSTGIDVNGQSGGGSINASIVDTVVNGSDNSGIVAESAGATTNVMLHRATSSNNGGNGVRTNGANVKLFIGNSVVAGNLTGLNNTAGLLFTYKTNQIDMNSTNQTGTISVQTPE